MIEVRSLRADDNLDHLILLSRNFFAEYEAHHPDFFCIDRLTDEDVKDYFSRWLDNEDGRAFVAVTDGKIVGYITVYVYPRQRYWRIKRAGEISGLLVHNAYRRQGIATQLLAQARAFLAERNVEYVTVYTATANRGALAFYAHCGMTPLYTTMLGDVSDSPQRGGQQ
jgi:ribosomal protein S18 acetylase RimI-like enzyme